MRTSPDGIALIKKFEGYRAKPYQDAVGLWTVGYGHLIGDGKTLPASYNKTFTLDEINALLIADLKRFERGIAMLVSVPLAQCEFDALVSFSFNLGLGAFQRSTLRQKLNRGDRRGAMESLLKYNKAGGKELKGLKLRREAEARLFLKAQTQNASV